MSRSWPMLMLRGSTYYYHRNVPKRLRPLLGGKAQIWKSLRTAVERPVSARNYMMR